MKVLRIAHQRMEPVKTPSTNAGNRDIVAFGISYPNPCEIPRKIRTVIGIG